MLSALPLFTVFFLKITNELSATLFICSKYILDRLFMIYEMSYEILQNILVLSYRRVEAAYFRH